MDWATAFAGIGGALQGAGEAHRWVKEEERLEENRRLAKEERDRRIRADEAAAAHNKKVWEQQDTDRAANAVLDSYGEGAVLPPQAAQALEKAGRGGRVSRMTPGGSGGLMESMLYGYANPTMQPSAATLDTRRNDQAKLDAAQLLKDKEKSDALAAFQNNPQLQQFIPLLLADQAGVSGLRPEDLLTPEQRGAQALAEDKPKIDYQAGVTRTTQAQDDARGVSNARKTADYNHELAIARDISRAILAEGNSTTAAARNAQGPTDPFDDETVDATTGAITTTPGRSGSRTPRTNTLPPDDMIAAARASGRPQTGPQVPPMPDFSGTDRKPTPAATAPRPPQAAPQARPPAPAAAQPPTQGSSGVASLFRAPSAPGGGMAAPAAPQARPQAAPAPTAPTAQGAAPSSAPVKMTPREQNIRGQLVQQMRMVEDAKTQGRDPAPLLMRLRALRAELEQVRGR